MADSDTAEVIKLHLRRGVLGRKNFRRNNRIRSLSVVHSIPTYVLGTNRARLSSWVSTPYARIEVIWRAAIAAAYHLWTLKPYRKRTSRRGLVIIKIF